MPSWKIIEVPIPAIETGVIHSADSAHLDPKRICFYNPESGIAATLTGDTVNIKETNRVCGDILGEIELPTHIERAFINAFNSQRAVDNLIPEIDLLKFQYDPVPGG